MRGVVQARHSQGGLACDVLRESVQREQKANLIPHSVPHRIQGDIDCDLLARSRRTELRLAARPILPTGRRLRLEADALVDRDAFRVPWPPPQQHPAVASVELI